MMRNSCVRFPSARGAAAAPHIVANSRRINSGRLAAMLLPKSVIRRGLVREKPDTTVNFAAQKALKYVMNQSPSSGPKAKQVPFDVSQSAALLKIAKFRASSKKLQLKKRRHEAEVAAHLKELAGAAATEKTNKKETQQKLSAKQTSVLSSLPCCSPSELSMVEAEAEWQTKLQSQRNPQSGSTTPTSTFRTDHHLTKDEYAAVLLYSQGTTYEGLNQALRSLEFAPCMTTATAQFGTYLSILLGGLKKLQQREVVGMTSRSKKKAMSNTSSAGGRKLYRGVSTDCIASQPGTYSKGSIVTWWGISSCSSNEDAALDFTTPMSPSSANKSSPLVGSVGSGLNKNNKKASLSTTGSTLFTIDAASAVSISSLSFFPGEAESLLLPGTQFEVVRAVPGSKASKWMSRVHLREIGNVVEL